MKKIYKYLRLVNIIGSHKLLFSQTQYIFSQFSCTLFFYYTYCLHRRRISCFIKDLISFFFWTMKPITRPKHQAHNQVDTSWPGSQPMRSLISVWSSFMNLSIVIQYSCMALLFKSFSFLLAHAHAHSLSSSSCSCSSRWEFFPWLDN